jgi:hypothetical protein
VKRHFPVNAKKGGRKAKSIEDTLLGYRKHLVQFINNSSLPDSVCEDNNLRELLRFSLGNADLLKQVLSQLDMGRRLFSSTRKD